MSVGKQSIRRAANAGAKKTVKTTSGMASEITDKAVTKTTAEKKMVKKSVIFTQDAEKLETVFVTGDKKETAEEPVHINEELPIYLL